MTMITDPFSDIEPVEKRLLLSALIGNFLENFDIMLCALLAPLIAITFFPTTSHEHQLTNTFLLFFVAYLSRPLGSLLIGLYADQIGRKRMLIFSIVVTGISTPLIGVIPSYDYIGMNAVPVFCFFRFLQNLSVGGEYISSIAYIIENTKKRQGFYGSFISIGVNLGGLVASLLILLTMNAIDLHNLPSWSWRLIFLITLLGMCFGIWVRQALPESLDFIIQRREGTAVPKKSILMAAFQFIHQYPLKALGIMGLTWLGVSETSILFVYSPIHLYTFNHFSQQNIMTINVLSYLVLIPFIPFFGYLADKYDKLQLILITSLTFACLAYPYFWVLTYGHFYGVLIMKMIFSVPSACFYAVAPVYITSAFPVTIRCTALALIYQLTASLAGGLTPLTLLTLTKASPHIVTYPALFLIASVLLCITSIFVLNHRTSYYGYQTRT